jgi:hypothetical protein
VLLHTPTFAEHRDADRFRADVSEFLNIPITIETAGRGLWEMIRDRKHLPNDSLPWCTSELKLNPQDKYLKRLEKAKIDFTIYVGIGADEWGRAQKITARNEAAGRKVEFPLAKKFLSGEDCKKIVREEIKICLPEPYLYLSHNNCIPCYKGGQGHWYKVWKHYPRQFSRALEAERKAENTVFVDITLSELASIWEHKPPQMEMFNDYMPCMCAI